MGLSTVAMLMVVKRGARAHTATRAHCIIANQQKRPCRWTAMLRYGSHDARAAEKQKARGNIFH